MSDFEGEEIDSDEEMILFIERFRRFVKSQRKMTSKGKEEKKMTHKVKKEKKMTPSKKKGEALIATRRDSEVEVVEGCSTSSVECENNYFTFPVSYHEEAQAITKCVSLEDLKIDDLKFGNQM